MMKMTRPFKAQESLMLTRRTIGQKPGLGLRSLVFVRIDSFCEQNTKIAIRESLLLLFKKRVMERRATGAICSWA